jgi:hypothetical protein
MPQEEEKITDADVKKQFDEISNKPEDEGSEESSTEETESAETSTEDVKPETAEVEDEEKPVPYSRFKEVNSRKTELEELAEQAKEFIVKDPVTGKLTLKLPTEESKKEEVEDKRFDFTEEESIALDSVQLKAIEKLFGKLTYQQTKQFQEQQQYKTETDKWWAKTQEDFPTVKDKNSELYKRADKILREQHVVWGKDGNTFYIPPKAQYYSVLQAEKELTREGVKTKQAKIEEKKTQKQQIFVEKKGGTQQTKKKVDEKEFEELDSQSQEDALREQFEESKTALDE